MNYENQQLQAQKQIADQINNHKWETVKELRSLLADHAVIDSELKTDNEHQLAMSRLYVSPAYLAQIEGKEDYPIWAIDDQGYALVGDNATSIQHVSEI